MKFNVYSVEYQSITLFYLAKTEQEVHSSIMEYYSVVDDKGIKNLKKMGKVTFDDGLVAKLKSESKLHIIELNFPVHGNVIN